jgi:hypothetical protein
MFGPAAYPQTFEHSSCVQSVLEELFLRQYGHEIRSRLLQLGAEGRGLLLLDYIF